MGCFEEHGRAVVEDPDGSVTSSISVSRRPAGSRQHPHPTLWATRLVDVAQGRHVDIMEGRDAAILRR